MKYLVGALSACLLIAIGGVAGRWIKPEAKTDKFSLLFSNDRFKSESFEDGPIDDFGDEVIVSGMWMPESDPSKSLVFPEQTKIICTRSDMTCRSYTESPGVMQGMVKIEDVNINEFHVEMWDTNSLRASYGPDKYANVGNSDRCHHTVITMNFASGVVSDSDIPTHEKGCEIFTETNTYRLKQGYYYIDTSPDNDLDKPKKKSSE